MESSSTLFNNSSSTRSTAKACGVSASSVSKYVREFKQNNTLSIKSHSGGRKPKLDNQDLLFLKQELEQNPTMYLDEMKDKLSTRPNNPKVCMNQQFVNS